MFGLLTWDRDNREGKVSTTYNRNNRKFPTTLGGVDLFPFQLWLQGWFHHWCFLFSSFHFYLFVVAISCNTLYHIFGFSASSLLISGIYNTYFNRIRDRIEELCWKSSCAFTFTYSLQYQHRFVHWFIIYYYCWYTANILNRYISF